MLDIYHVYQMAKHRPTHTCTIYLLCPVLTVLRHHDSTKDSIKEKNEKKWLTYGMREGDNK